VYTGFQWGNPRDGEHLKEPGVDGKIILKSILETWNGGTDWVNLALGRKRRLAVVNAVMNLRVS
jgi:hypothetical protein